MAEDITSEIFIKVYKNLEASNLNALTFKIWIYKISKNVLIDFYRSKGRQPEELLIDDFKNNDDMQDIIKNKFKEENQFDDKELNFENPDLIEALSALPELQRETIILRYAEDLNYRTIGKILNKNETAVRVLKFRALINLKNKLEMKNG